MHPESPFLRRNRPTVATFLSLILLPALFNLVVMWLEVGSDVLLPAISCAGECSIYCTCYPIPGVLLGLSGFSLLLGAVALLGIHVSTRAWLTKLPRVVRLLFVLLLAISTAILFRYVGGFLMPVVWLPVFGDYLLGFPVSSSADKASWYVIFPLVIAIFLLAAFRNRNAHASDKGAPGTQEAA